MQMCYSDVDIFVITRLARERPISKQQFALKHAKHWLHTSLWSETILKHKIMSQPAGSKNLDGRRTSRNIRKWRENLWMQVDVFYWHHLIRLLNQVSVKQGMKRLLWWRITLILLLDPMIFCYLRIFLYFFKVFQNHSEEITFWRTI